MELEVSLYRCFLKAFFNSYCWFKFFFILLAWLPARMGKEKKCCCISHGTARLPVPVGSPPPASYKTDRTKGDIATSCGQQPDTARRRLSWTGVTQLLLPQDFLIYLFAFYLPLAQFTLDPRLFGFYGTYSTLPQ